MKYYPAFLNLKGKNCLVVGGGVVAQGKAEKLLEAGCKLTLVSPKITSSLKALIQQRKIIYKEGNFKDSHLRGKFLVVGATSARKVNERIYRIADKHNILCNIVDKPDLCNFIVPSSISRGPLQIAISTGGISPSLSKKIRKQLEREFGPEYQAFLKLMARLRPVVKRIENEKVRQAIFHKLSQSNVFSLLKQGRTKRAEKLARRIINSASS